MNEEQLKIHFISLGLMKEYSDEELLEHWTNTKLDQFKVKCKKGKISS